VLAEFPVDAARYWAAGTSIGDDFPYREGDLEAGERLLQKLWNASRLVDQLTPPAGDVPEVDTADLEPIDRWLLAELDDLVETITERFDNYAFSKARTELRTFFWSTFCDDYLEIAKQRLDGGPNPSTEFALVTAHRTFLKLFAPFLPHVTEEVWTRVSDAGQSLHTTDWPTPRGYEADLQGGETAMEVISALRRYKTDNRLALNETLARVDIYGDVGEFGPPIAEVMHVETVQTHDDEPEITTEISGVDLDYSVVGPEFGNEVGDIDAAIEAGEFEVAGDTLVVGEEFELDAEMFELERSREYSGEGEMVETDHAVVIVQQ